MKWSFECDWRGVVLHTKGWTCSTLSAWLSGLKSAKVSGPDKKGEHVKMEQLTGPRTLGRSDSFFSGAQDTARSCALVPGPADRLAPPPLPAAPRAISCALGRFPFPIYKRARTRVSMVRSCRTAGVPADLSSGVSFIRATSVRASSTSEPRWPQTSSV